MVQLGISEKVALAVNCASSFFTGFILAYIRNWRLALALSSLLPCIGVTGATMGTLVSKYEQRSLGYVAEGGSFAEEVISTIRTAQAFGTQQTLARLYNVSVKKAFDVDYKSAVVTGCGVPLFFFFIYGAYALGVCRLTFSGYVILTGCPPSVQFWHDPH
jgi:ATP-binding cassette subfamily B (MDR/TAP) protein 1